MINKYIKGNCFEVLPKVPDGSVDLIMGDLPIMLGM
jgi:DNA modification methylase